MRRFCPSDIEAMPNPTALFIGDDGEAAEALRQLCTKIENLALAKVNGVDEAGPYLDQGQVVLALVHATSHTADGLLSFLGKIRQDYPAIPAVVVGDGDLSDKMAEKLRLSAVDCLNWKADGDRLQFLIDQLTICHRAPLCLPRTGSPTPRPELQQLADLYPTHCESMDSLLGLVSRVAPQDTTILLSGETGTGKSKLARVIHELSPRRNEPFLVIDCGSLCGSLIESEIFGHVRGAFSSADRDYPGKFCAVGRGTLFLDDIESIPYALQAKLLRAVDEKVFEPVGSTQARRLEARLIVASNCHLEQEVAAGRFRADLYYRLNIVGFHLPPLRERISSIEPLALRFTREFAEKTGRHVTGIAPEAIQAMEQYHWPGNVRELRNTIQRAVVLGDDNVIRLEDLPDSVRKSTGSRTNVVGNGTLSAATVQSSGSGNLAEIKEEAELSRLIEVLRKHGKNRRQAAKELGISRTALYNKLNKYGLAHAGKEKAASSTESEKPTKACPTAGG